MAYLFATPGNVFKDACTCLFQNLEPELVVAVTEFVPCDPRPVCEFDDGTPDEGAIIDCTALSGLGLNSDDFCKLSSLEPPNPSPDLSDPNQGDPPGPCCGGFISLSTTAELNATARGGSCITEFNIGGSTFLFRADIGPPCPAGWRTE